MKVKEKHRVSPLRQCSSSLCQNLHRYLTTIGLKFLEHLPYSPDFAPCHFSLFQYVKMKLKKDTFFSSDENLQGLITTSVPYSIVKLGLISEDKEVN
ncbi:hypothetical protein NPIL_179461 [Nephila pilipes]|uniref:Uncharacterized protein n=1 Tax=Nephila pilipes TaxID=299642 RepID=A0A8X6N0U8_NEPPI|nr:hypothetical protein NPIL_179461 [Nephila pilipes]